MTNPEKEMDYQEAFDIINKSSLKGKGSEPSCFLEEDDLDGTPTAELGWNTPDDARWFFFTNIAVALKEANYAGRKQLAGKYLKKIQEIYEACNDERIQAIQFKIRDLGKELQKEADRK